METCPNTDRTSWREATGRETYFRVESCAFGPASPRVMLAPPRTTSHTRSPPSSKTQRLKDSKTSPLRPNEIPSRAGAPSDHTAHGLAASLCHRRAIIFCRYAAPFVMLRYLSARTSRQISTIQGRPRSYRGRARLPLASNCQEARWIGSSTTHRSRQARRANGRETRPTRSSPRTTRTVRKRDGSGLQQCIGRGRLVMPKSEPRDRSSRPVPCELSGSSLDRVLNNASVEAGSSCRRASSETEAPEARTMRTVSKRDGSGPQP
jgi:hypothetical protein